MAYLQTPASQLPSLTPHAEDNDWRLTELRAPFPIRVKAAERSEKPDVRLMRAPDSDRGTGAVCGSPAGFAAK
jgi:hypothetical protein